MLLYAQKQMLLNLWL